MKNISNYKFKVVFIQLFLIKYVDLDIYLIKCICNIFYFYLTF
ncbi:hypothetical protein EMIT040CA3_60142 [Bacillus pseudomycoides]